MVILDLVAAGYGSLVELSNAPASDIMDAYEYMHYRIEYEHQLHLMNNRDK